MFRKTSKLLIYTIAMLMPLIAGIVVVMAKPAQQATYPYAFSGTVIDDDHGSQVPAMDIQITCGTFSTTTTCGQDGEWSTLFNLATVTATCDIELLLLPNYQAVRAEASQYIYPAGIVVSPTLVRHLDIPFVPDPNDPYHSNNFYIVKPTSATQTSHFSIEWYTDRDDPDYPSDGTIRGADYINVIADALEDAWPVYAASYDMPPATPGRSDRLIANTDTPTGHTLAWDFGDGTTASGTLTPTHAYGDNGDASPTGAYTVTLTVTDTTGLSAADGVVVAVGNVAPGVSISWEVTGEY
ncbi:MAG: PKD domain-containing protein [Anaerolineae bacterium]|nr:PKD domain-containing protein [Anaerolineae bacterium]